MARTRKPKPWQPTIGGLAHYASRHSSLSRGCPVRVLAEAIGGRMLEQGAKEWSELAEAA